MKNYYPYFGYPSSLYQKHDDEDDIIKDIPNDMEICSEMGCIKGSVLLLYSRIPCTKCNGTGRVKKTISK